MTDAPGLRATTGTDPAGTPRVPLVPGWLDNLAALAWRIIVVAALGVVVWYVCTLLWTVTASIAVAVVVSAVLAPVVLRLRARGRTRNAAALIVWAAALLVGLIVVLVLALAFLPDLADLARRLTSGVDAVKAQVAALDLPPVVGEVIQTAVHLLLGLGGSLVGGIVDAAAGVVTVAILAVFLVFFFLRDGDRAWLWVFQALGDQKRERIMAAGDDALGRVGGYLRGTTVLAALMAVTDLVFLLLLGVPLAVPLAILAFLAGYIPYFGGLVATGIILLVTYSSNGAGAVLVLLVLIGVRNMILGYGVRPTLYGRTVNIHPAVVLIALPAGFELAGIVGLFAAVPVTAVIMAVASALVAIAEPDERPPLPALVPAWLDRLAQASWRILVGLALVALVVSVYVTVPIVVVPVVVALILAATLQPMVEALVRRGRSRGVAVALSVGGLTIGLAVLLTLAAVALFDDAGPLQGAVSAGATSLDDSLGGHAGIGRLATAMTLAGIVSTVITIVQEAAGAAVVGLLSVLLAFYFLRDGARLWAGSLRHVRPDARDEVAAAGSRAFSVLGGYMIGTAAISFVGAASQLFIMVVLGLPLAIPVFVLSFFLCFIPYIGGFLSTGAAFLIAVSVGTPLAVVVMAVWTIVFNIVQGNIVSPLVYGRTVHLHPAIVLVAIPAGAAVAGIVGMFIVVPALGVVAVTWRTVLGVMGSRRQGTAASAENEKAQPAPAPAAG